MHRLCCPEACGLFLARDLTGVPCLAEQSLKPWTTREALFYVFTCHFFLSTSTYADIFPLGNIHTHPSCLFLCTGPATTGLGRGLSTLTGLTPALSSPHPFTGGILAMVSLPHFPAAAPGWLSTCIRSFSLNVFFQSSLPSPNRHSS